jgi:hypothetical protein
MMNENRTPPSRQQSTIHGNVIRAEAGGQINIAQGENIEQGNISDGRRAEMRDPWGALDAELARIRLRLQDDEGPAASDDRDDAADAVDDLQRILPDMEKGSADSQRKLRRRIRELIGVLAPVAEIIGGVAALEAILQHL